MRQLARWILNAVAFAALTIVAGCVGSLPPSDTGNTLSPTTIALPDPSQPLAYEPDMRRLFASDCQYCHGGYRVDDGYSMNTYDEVMTDARPGFAESGLIRITQPSGRMYLYWSGSDATRLAKAELVRRWIVNFNAQRTR